MIFVFLLNEQFFIISLFRGAWAIDRWRFDGENRSLVAISFRIDYARMRIRPLLLEGKRSIAKLRENGQVSIRQKYNGSGKNIICN